MDLRSIISSLQSSMRHHKCVHSGAPIANESVPKIVINNAINYFLTAISILVVSNQNCFRVLFDKIASIYFIRKIYLRFINGNDQPREPALCQLYRHTFVSYAQHRNTALRIQCELILRRFVPAEIN